MIPYCILAIEDDDDRVFMEELFQNYQRLMYNEICKIVRNPWNTEDVMQSTLIKLIDKISTLRSRSRDQLVNYIISACKNTAYNYVRDHAHPQESPFEDYLNTASIDQDGHTLELRLMKREELDCLARAWPKLDERTRRLLEGYYILEKPMTALASELDIKPESVRMALTRARKKAYNLLEEELEPQK
ncbi:MAG: sigma-70 family RNA polymerase sigma factor [Oscillospiraceae bacterium]